MTGTVGLEPHSTHRFLAAWSRFRPLDGDVLATVLSLPRVCDTHTHAHTRLTTTARRVADVGVRTYTY